MASLPYIQLYTSDYLADTAHLSTLEHGAYLLLIFNYWQRGESFKAKDERSLNKRLASVARLSEQEWNDVKDTLEEFFEATETEWRHSRIERDLNKVNSKSEKASAAGKASASARSNKRSANAEQTLNHTDTYTDTKTDTYTSYVKTETVLGDVTVTDFVETAETEIGADVINIATQRHKPPPYQEIVNAYHELLPTLAQVYKLTETRKTRIKALWRDELSEVKQWRNYFKFIGESDFLMGRSQPRDGRVFVADFDFITHMSNFVKIAEEKYHHGQKILGR